MDNNSAELCGTLAGAPRFSHSSRGKSFYTFPLAARRLSGTEDVVNVVLPVRLLEGAELSEGSRARLLGEVRSFNNRSGVGSRLVISFFARRLAPADGPDLNRVLLRGTLCKPPNYRRTPLGREICDLMLAVNRRCGRSDYLPCIAWGAGAEAASLWTVGTETGVDGRLQSRRYVKQTEEGEVEKTAYEVSVSEFFEI